MKNKIYLAVIALLLSFSSFSQLQNSLQFDGTNDFVSLNAAIGAGHRYLTIEAWVRTSGPTGDMQAIVSSEAHEFVHFQLFSGGNIVAYTNAGTINLPILAESTCTWKHVAVVFEPGRSTLYENGAVVATDPLVYSTITTPSRLNIGRGYTGARYFKGNIDEVRIWNVARTKPEITSSMTRCLSGTETGLLAYYNCDNTGIPGGNNAGNTNLPDLAPAGGTTNGSLAGFALTGNSSNWVEGFPISDCGPLAATACPPVVSSVPTLGTWGLITLVLLTLSLVTLVLVGQRKMEVAGGGYSVSGLQFTFNRAGYFNVIKYLLPVAMVGFLAIHFTIGTNGLLDLSGTVVSTLIVGYIVHLLKKA